MNPNPPPTQRRWRRIAIIVLTLAAGGAWWARDPWPSRVVIALPGQEIAALAPRFSADGTALLVSSTGGVRAWDLATGRPRQAPAAPVVVGPGLRDDRSPVLAADRRSYAGIVEPSPMNQEVVWVDAASGVIQARFPVGSGQIVRLAFGPADRSIRALILNSADGGLVALTADLASGTTTRGAVTGGDKLINCHFSSISPDGRLVAHIPQEWNGVLLWDLLADQPQGGLLPTAPTTQVDPFMNPFFSADGRTLFVLRTDDQVECWDVAAARLIRTLPLPIPAQQTLTQLTASPDARMLALGLVESPPTNWAGRNWNRVRRLIPGPMSTVQGDLILIDATSGRTLARTHGSIDAIFAPDGRSVVTFGLDESIAIRALPPLP